MVFLEILQNSQENAYARVFFLIKLQALGSFKNTFFFSRTPPVAASSSKSYACNFIKKQTRAQMFCCEFCKISKNIFYYRTPPVAASVLFLKVVALEI